MSELKIILFGSIIIIAIIMFFLWLTTKKPEPKKIVRFTDHYIPIYEGEEDKKDGLDGNKQ